MSYQSYKMDIINALYSWVIFWIVYWISGIVFSYANRKQRPLEKLGDVIEILLLNMIWTYFGTLGLFVLPIRLDIDSNILVKLLLTNLITEIWFYHVHLMCHHPALYKKVHKLHHMFTQPYSLTGLYCSPYEAVICNVFAVGLGPVMLDITAPYLYIWFGLVALNTTFSHSGMKLKYLSDGSHDKHHHNFTTNFGTIGLFDWLYDTN